jgi:hypothetical protein
MAHPNLTLNGIDYVGDLRYPDRYTRSYSDDFFHQHFANIQRIIKYSISWQIFCNTVIKQVHYLVNL